MAFGDNDYSKGLAGLGYSQDSYNNAGFNNQDLLMQAWNPQTKDWTGAMDSAIGSNGGSTGFMDGISDAFTNNNGGFDLSKSIGTLQSGIGLASGLMKMFGGDPEFDLKEKAVKQNMRLAENASRNQTTAYNNEMSRGQAGRTVKMDKAQYA